MKLNVTLLSLIGLAVTGSIALARDNTPATESTPAVAATTPAVEPTPAPASVPAPTTLASADTAASAAPAPAPEPAAASAPHDPSAVIPLIVMDEVPLTDAIKNLARQANLNYMLDPKISYGTPDANGVSHTQPTVSLRWENLTADQALNAVLNTYNLQLIDDPKTHVMRITIKDPAAPDPLITKIIQLKYASATNLVQVISSSAVLGDRRSKVAADVRTSQLVVVATEKEVVTIDELVTRLDTPTKQVLIEARIVETSKNPTSSKGVDWSGTLQAQHVTFGNGTTTGTYTSSSGNTTANVSGTGTSATGAAVLPPVGSPTVPYTSPGSAPVGSGTTAGTTSGNLLNTLVGNGGLSLNTAKGLNPSTFFLNADGASAVLSFLNNNFDATVLSTPRAVTLDNEEAILSVTTAQPIFETTAGTQGSPGGSQVIYTNLGTILHVTPRISANNSINLKVIPEVSDVGAIVTKTVEGLVNQADSFELRRIETRVLIPSGNTLVMGGLVGDSRSKNSTKVPFLGDIPFLGSAFRSETKSQNKKNLIIFVTPTIVENEDFQPAQTTFLKTKVPDLKADDFGAWDSSEKQDWSKLMAPKNGAPVSADDAVWPTTK